ncbi:hypothetical protein Sru01_53740 [Sphaerisporangium rufum]|uniref:Uncharacterized protein n=1 Tax=Sphaerisporangium rufum TaxID=1381558 RepID=A0A919RAK8_9ACTN|nr:hypothetical protein [Sphaerisporangium rufum]GII80392.1 hypothetical protein Sru01_53740 [Sphaerisporangium rufum]
MLRHVLTAGALVASALVFPATPATRPAEAAASVTASVGAPAPVSARDHHKRKRHASHKPKRHHSAKHKRHQHKPKHHRRHR